jgi:hypothetical protein
MSQQLKFCCCFYVCLNGYKAGRHDNKYSPFSGFVVTAFDSEVEDGSTQLILNRVLFTICNYE